VRALAQVAEGRVLRADRKSRTVEAALVGRVSEVRAEHEARSAEVAIGRSGDDAGVDDPARTSMITGAERSEVERRRFQRGETLPAVSAAVALTA